MYNQKMKKIKDMIMVLAVLLTLSFAMLPHANAVLYGGIDFPMGSVSFADSVISYIPGLGVVSPYDDPKRALGIPDDTVLALGLGGTLVLKFDDNSLTTSGDSTSDLYIFEYGSLEPTYVAISTDGQNWIDLGESAGGTSGIDIDSKAGVTLGERYSYIRLIDKNIRTLPADGADIDAVGAYSSAPPVVVPEPVSSALFIIGGATLGVRQFLHRKKKTSTG